MLGMGKLGGDELNVSSDIDLIFVYPEDGDTRPPQPGQRQLSNHEFFIRLGKKLIARPVRNRRGRFHLPGRHGAAPERRVRPAGGQLQHGGTIPDRAGPRVGTLRLGQGACADRRRRTISPCWTRIVQPFVYRRYLDFGVDRRHAQHACADPRRSAAARKCRHPERSDNVKLGRGGIREIEFLAQVFQLIRGGRDPRLRDRSTRRTLRHTGAETAPGRGRSRAVASRPTHSCATSNTGCSTSTTRRPIRCRPMRTTG